MERKSQCGTDLISQSGAEESRPPLPSFLQNPSLVTFRQSRKKFRVSVIGVQLVETCESTAEAVTSASLGNGGPSCSVQVSNDNGSLPTFQTEQPAH